MSSPCPRPKRGCSARRTRTSTSCSICDPVLKHRTTTGRPHGRWGRPERFCPLPDPVEGPAGIAHVVVGLPVRSAGCNEANVAVLRGPILGTTSETDLGTNSGDQCAVHAVSGCWTRLKDPLAAILRVIFSSTSVRSTPRFGPTSASARCSPRKRLPSGTPSSMASPSRWSVVLGSTVELATTALRPQDGHPWLHGGGARRPTSPPTGPVHMITACCQI